MSKGGLFRVAEHQESLQILHYQNGQKYEPHNDYFHDSVNARPEHGGQRVATILMCVTGHGPSVVTIY